jgi:prepilin-type N-terminal cleavage/methylation domain-containing protein
MRVYDDPTNLRRGFTLPEMLIAIVIIILLAAMAAPATAKQLRHGRVNQAANVVAGDLENAVSYSARLRKPVRITRTSATSFTVTERATGTVIQRRELGTDTEWKIATLTFSTATIDVFPAGITSGPLTITLSEGGYARDVRLTRAGLAQVVR